MNVMQMNLPCGRVLHSQNPFHRSSAQPKPISPEFCTVKPHVTILQALFRRGQLKALVDLHSETEGLGGQLAAEEINVIRGALDLTNKTAAKGMTPLEKVRRFGYKWHALRKEKQSKENTPHTNYTIWRQFNEKPSFIPGCSAGMH